MHIHSSTEGDKPAFSQRPFKVYRRKKCPVTDKSQFSSEKSARKRIREIQIRPGSNHYKVPQVAYFCPHCKHWHLTSRQKQKQAG
jgi:hypothetical protein